MRAVLLSFLSAMILGLAGGYGWSVWTAPPPHHGRPPKAAFAPIPESPEALPAEQDREWTERAEDKGTPVVANSAAVEQSVHYSGCDEVRAAGKAPLHAGQPGYREDMDGDGDGLACEPIRGR